MVHPSNDHPDLHEGIPTREQLDEMSTAELLEALEQTLFSMTEENYDGELLDAYLDELDRKSPMPEHPATDESYERFKARVGKMNAAINPLESAPAASAKPKPRHTALRTALVAVIAAACLLSCMVVVQAAGLDVFGSIARWTDSLFGFGAIGEPAASPSPTGTQEVTVEYIETLLPTVPEGFVMGEPVVFRDDIGGHIEYLVSYTSGENFISFSAVEQYDNGTSIYQKDARDVTKINISGQEFYIFMNNDNVSAAWKISSLECYISTNLDEDCLTQILYNSYMEI